MRIRDPKTTALIFASGKMVVTGAKSEEHSRLAARKVYMHWRLMYIGCCRRFSLSHTQAMDTRYIQHISLTYSMLKLCKSWVSMQHSR